MSRITVLGTGYLGTAHAACLAEMGFEVLGIDTDQAKIDALGRGELPFYEPGLAPLLRSGLKSGRLSFSNVERVRKRADHPGQCYLRHNEPSAALPSP